MKSDTPSRSTLLNKTMGFNQLRNSIYWLQRIMKTKKLDHEDIQKRLREMGKNIAKTIINEKQLNPKLDLNFSNIPALYDTLFQSKVKILTENSEKIVVEDPKCAFCRYQYSDISIPGCTVAASSIQELLSKSNISIESVNILKSQTMGDAVCVHEYILSKKTTGGA